MTAWWRHSAEQLAGSDASAVEILDSHLGRISQVDPHLNAMSVVLTKWAHAEAAARDGARASGEPTGPLHGVPVVIKEEIDVAGCVTTFGGRGNQDPATADAEVVSRLRQAGAVIVGKTTMPEFGAFPYTESDAYGVTRNPWHPGHTPGGSSGGTAVAVATGMAAVGMGGDGGGSIRIPAACVGLFGLKPQRGRVTTAPHEHLWWALGTAGPLSRTVRDSALVYDVIRGNVDTDLFRAGATGSFLAATEREPGRLRIGWSARPASPGIRPDPVHVAALEETARLLGDLGHDVREVNPRYPDSTAAFVPQFFAGIRAEADAVDRFERLERRTRETYRLGSWVTPSVIDRAIAASQKVSAKANRVFDEVDVLMTPTMAHRPPRVGILGGAGTVRSMLAAMPAIAYTAVWNVAGNPAAGGAGGGGPPRRPPAGARGGGAPTSRRC